MSFKTEKLLKIDFFEQRMPLRRVNELCFKSWETKRSRSCETKPLIFKLSKCQVWLLELCVFPADCARSSLAVWWLLAAPSHCPLLERGNSPSW